MGSLFVFAVSPPLSHPRSITQLCDINVAGAHPALGPEECLELQERKFQTVAEFLIKLVHHS